MLAPYKRRRHDEENEEDTATDRRRRGANVYWDWRAVDPDDYNPVYPFLPPPTSGTDVIIPFPMPPFASDWDFYLSNQSILNIRTKAPIIHTVNGLTLALGDGLEIQDNKLVATGAGGGIKYTGTAPIVVNDTTKTISLTIDNKTLKVLNSALTGTEYKGAAPITVAGDLIALNVSSGFKMNTSQALEVNLGDGLKFGSGGPIELDLDSTGGLQIDTTTKKLKLNLSSPMESSAVGLGIKLGSGVLVNDGGELTLAVKEPIATDNGQLQLKIGEGLAVSSGALVATAQGGASITATAPLKLTDDEMSLTLGPGLQVENDALRTNIIAVPPITVVDNSNENFISMQYGQGLELDTSYGLAVNCNPPLFTTPGKNEPLTLKYDQSTLKLDTDSLAVKTAAPLKVADDASGITLSYGAGLTVNTQGQLEATGQSTSVTAENPISITTSGDTTTVGLKTGQGLIVNDEGNLTLGLTAQTPLSIPATTSIITLNYEGGLVNSSGSLAINAQAPLYTGGQSPNTYLRLHTDQNTLTSTTDSGLGVRFSTPLITQGTGLTVDYSPPLTITDDKLSLAVEDPLTLDEQTNNLKIRLGSGLSTDNSGALTATAPAAPTLTAAAPLQIVNDKISLNIDHGFLVDTDTNDLKLNVAEPLSVNNNTGLGLNYDGSLQKNTENALGVKLSSPLILSDGGVTLNVGDNITVNASGALTVTLPTYASPLNVNTSKEVSVNLAGGLYVTTTGSLAIRPGAGLHIEGSVTPGVSYISINRGPGFSGLPGQPLTLNLNPPLRIDQNKVDLNYEAPLTVIDDNVLGVTVETPLVIGQNAIELSLGSSMQKSDSGALEVKAKAPLATTAVDGLTLSIDQFTLKVNSTNQLEVLPPDVKMPLYYQTWDRELGLSYNSRQFNGSQGLNLASPVYTYQTPINTPLSLTGVTGLTGTADLHMSRIGPNVLVNFNLKCTTTVPTGSQLPQVWSIDFDQYQGFCVTGTMQVVDGNGNVVSRLDPTFILPSEDAVNANRLSGTFPICTANGVYRGSWTIMHSPSFMQYWLQIRSYVSTGQIPSFNCIFMYESGIEI